MTETDLHGNAPDSSPVVLLLIDTINDLEFEGGEALLEPAVLAARRIAELKRRAKDRGVPVVYANDNFGRWRSNFEENVDHCLEDDVRGRPLAELLAPDPDDYSVLKPKHSAFYETTLHLLLDHFGCEHLILTGFTADMCLLFTGVDAFMRGYRLSIPADCTASIDPEDNHRALQYLESTLEADITESSSMDLDALLSAAGR